MKAVKASLAATLVDVLVAVDGLSSDLVGNAAALIGDRKLTELIRRDRHAEEIAALQQKSKSIGEVSVCYSKVLLLSNCNNLINMRPCMGRRPA